MRVAAQFVLRNHQPAASNWRVASCEEEWPARNATLAKRDGQRRAALRNGRRSGERSTWASASCAETKGGWQDRSSSSGSGSFARFMSFSQRLRAGGESLQQTDRSTKVLSRGRCATQHCESGAPRRSAERLQLASSQTMGLGFRPSLGPQPEAGGWRKQRAKNTLVAAGRRRDSFRCNCFRTRLAAGASSGASRVCPLRPSPTTAARARACGCLQVASRCRKH